MKNMGSVRLFPFHPIASTETYTITKSHVKILKTTSSTFILFLDI